MITKQIPRFARDDIQYIQSARSPAGTFDFTNAPLAGVGVAGAATGTIAGVMTLEKKQVADENCDEDRKVCNQRGKDANDSGRLLGTVSTIGFAVGALGLGGAFYLWVSEPSDPTSARIKARVSPDFGFVSVERRF